MFRWVPVFFLVACGTDKEKTFSGDLGQCRMSNAEASIELCMAYSYSVKAEKDPGPDAASELEKSCNKQTDQDGEWSTSKACSTNAAYRCDASASAGSATVTLKVYIDGDGATASNAETLCEAYDNGKLTKL